MTDLEKKLKGSQQAVVNLLAKVDELAKDNLALENEVDDLHGEVDDLSDEVRELIDKVALLDLSADDRFGLFVKANQKKRMLKRELRLLKARLGEFDFSELDESEEATIAGFIQHQQDTIKSQERRILRLEIGDKKQPIVERWVRMNRLAKEVLANKVLLGSMVPKDLGMVFMPLMFMGSEGAEDMKADDIVEVYEYYDRAGPRSINGYPCFFSMHVLNRKENKTLRRNMKIRLFFIRIITPITDRLGNYDKTESYR